MGGRETDNVNKYGRNNDIALYTPCQGARLLTLLQEMKLLYAVTLTQLNKNFNSGTIMTIHSLEVWLL